MCANQICLKINKIIPNVDESQSDKDHLSTADLYMKIAGSIQQCQVFINFPTN